MCGSDLQDGFFRREFWSFEKWGRKGAAVAFVAENEIRLGLRLGLRKKRTRK